MAELGLTEWFGRFTKVYHDDLCKGHVFDATLDELATKAYEADRARDPAEVAQEVFAREREADARATFELLADRAGIPLDEGLVRFAYLLVEECATIGDEHVDPEFGDVAGEHIRVLLGDYDTSTTLPPIHMEALGPLLEG